MPTDYLTKTGFHAHRLVVEHRPLQIRTTREVKISYDFDNHFHPYVSELVEQLNRRSVPGVLDVNLHAGLVQPFFSGLYTPNATDTVAVSHHPKIIDVSETGSYAGYNWELLFHVPTMIAVALSNSGRYPEAQRWFHYVFDPTCDDRGVEAPARYWKFLRFRRGSAGAQIDELLAVLAKPADECTPQELATKELIVAGYEAIRERPFRPHAVARTRPQAYQYWVVMKYLDNLIAWGDSLFRQDTAETVNEAIQLYVLAGNVLGPRPQRLPPRGTTRPRTYRQLKEAGLDPSGNALVTLEGAFPFNLFLPSTTPTNEESTTLFGVGRTLYFCVPENDKLLGYWDTVADRLFKIRHCMNIAGVVRQLPLFEPPIDPGLLVKAAAAGIDINSLVSGLNQPLSTTRSAVLIQKALDVCGEVRSLGASLLSALEKKDNEALARLRQSQDVLIQERLKDVKFLQWKESEEPVQLLLRARAAIFDRYRHYHLLLGADAQELERLREVTLKRPELTEATFDEVYADLVEQYAVAVPLRSDDPPPLAASGDPRSRSGANGPDPLFLTVNEDVELNVHAPAAQEKRRDAIAKDELFGFLGMLPNLGVAKGIAVQVSMEFGGPALSAVGRILAGMDRATADELTYQGSQAARVAAYERRADDWTQQANAAAHELMQNGRQIIAALLREQITHHEYTVHTQQLKQARDVDAFLTAKFTSTELHYWMQGELSRRFFECYRMAVDLARRAEHTMKHELMRPELDQQTFIRFDYWDSGRKGLLSGEALYLDVKRMELAHQEHDKREYELTRHVSLAQLDPVALLRLRATGTCEATVPEWLFDLDTPGHFMRRVRTVGVTIPAVTGPYTGVHCTVSLMGSSVRTSPALRDGQYARQGPEDTRFRDYAGAIESVVTSGAGDDSGLFETNLRDERVLPFEGAGATGTWRLELPAEFRQFDYDTISDVVLHIRYTAREGGAQLRQKAVERVRELVATADTSGLVRLLSLRHDFPAQWHAFTTGDAPFRTTISRDHLPYLVQRAELSIDRVALHAVVDRAVVARAVDAATAAGLTEGLNSTAGAAAVTLAADDTVLRRDPDAQVFLVLHYSVR